MHFFGQTYVCNSNWQKSQSYHSYSVTTLPNFIHWSSRYKKKQKIFTINCFLLIHIVLYSWLEIYEVEIFLWSPRHIFIGQTCYTIQLFNYYSFYYSLETRLLYNLKRLSVCLPDRNGMGKTWISRLLFKIEF